MINLTQAWSTGSAVSNGRQTARIRFIRARPRGERERPGSAIRVETTVVIRRIEGSLRPTARVVGVFLVGPTRARPLPHARGSQQRHRPRCPNPAERGYGKERGTRDRSKRRARAREGVLTRVGAFDGGRRGSAVISVLIGALVTGPFCDHRLSAHERGEG